MTDQKCGNCQHPPNDHTDQQIIRCLTALNPELRNRAEIQNALNPPRLQRTAPTSPARISL